MYSQKKLLPLSDYQVPLSDLLTCLIQEAEGPHRQNRYHLKRYLSSKQLSEGPSSSRRHFELTQSALDNPASPRIIQKALNPFKTRVREKQIDQMVAIKLANKNILRSINPLTPRPDSLKLNGIQLKIPDELKALDNEGISERNEITKLVDWFEFGLRNQFFLDGNDEQGILKNCQSDEGLIDRSEEFINLAFVKFFDLLRTQCNERAALFSILIEKFERIWKFKSLLKGLNQYDELKSLREKFEHQSMELSNYQIKASKLMKELKAELTQKNMELTGKDLEIKRLAKLVKVIKEERTQKLKKQMEVYEKMIKKIKNQVQVVLIDTHSKASIETKKREAEIIISELYIVEKFKEDNLKEEDFIEENNSEESQIINPTTSDKEIQASVETEEKETNLNFVYFNAETQTYQNDKDSDDTIENFNINIFEIDDEIRDLHHAGLIPPHAEIESWSAGYYTGIDRGKTLAQMESINTEENVPEENEANSDNEIAISEEASDEKKERREGERKEEHKRKRFQTKFRQFNFQKREKTVHMKIVKSRKIREEFVKANKEKMKKRGKMSKKLLMKTINGIYTSLIAKFKTEEAPDDFLEFIYVEFESKNSMKKVVERRIYDLLYSLANNSNILKAKNFLKFLDLSEKINEKPLTTCKDSLFVYISGLESIFKSKIGIMTDFSEYSDTFFIPTLRLIEFFRVYFSESFPVQRLSKMIEFIEKHSSIDKKRLNKGVIEIEFGLNYAVSQFEEHYSAILKSGMAILKAVTCDNHPYIIRKTDLVFIANILKPGKYLKEIDLYGENIKVDDIFSSSLREIFSEDFLESGKITREKAVQRTKNILEGNKCFEKTSLLENFLKFGSELDLDAVVCLGKLAEMYIKMNNHV